MSAADPLPPEPDEGPRLPPPRGAFRPDGSAPKRGDELAPAPFVDNGLPLPPEDFAEPPLVRSAASPALQPPHPGFGFALLWCALFLIVTQIIPGVAVAVGAVLFEIIRGGLDALNSPQAAQRIQDNALLPSIALAQYTAIFFSVLLLRLVAGRDWVRQVALRLPRVWQLLVVLLGFPALPILASGAYQVATLYLPGIQDVLAFWTAQLLAFAALWLVLWLAAGWRWNLRLLQQPLGVQFALVSVGLVIWVLASMGTYWLISFRFLRFPYLGPGLMEEMVQKFRAWPWWLAVLIIGVGPGLSEELWCRGYLGRGLLGHYGMVLGVLLASFLFGLIHLDPHQGTMAVLMGMVLHTSYLLTRSLWVPMLLHFLNNSLSVLGEHLGEVFAKIDTAPEEIHGLVYAAAGLLMAAAGWALYRGRARLVSAVEGQPPWQPAFPGVAHPPEGSETLLICPWPGWPAAALVVIASWVFVAVFYLAATGQLPQ